jgi:hypothetical protein
MGALAESPCTFNEERHSTICYDRAGCDESFFKWAFEMADGKPHGVGRVSFMAEMPPFVEPTLSLPEPLGI